MGRYGINTRNTLGVSVCMVRNIAKKIGRNHQTAQRLWKSGIHEARILAALVDVPELVTEKQMEDWAKGFDSWDVCDQVCSSLFDKTKFAWSKALSWPKREEEFVKRAGFVLMASLSVHNKEAENKKFEKFFPIIKKYAADERNFVKKAINWALRQIGKRNLTLNRKALKTAEEISKIDNRAARWIARDALRELTSEKIQKKVMSKPQRQIKLF